MSRTLTILFRRDPSKDHKTDVAAFEGYEILWPDGQPLSLGFDALCKHGQRLFGLGKHLAGCNEKLIMMHCFPLEGRDDDLNRIPGHRVRRFSIERLGDVGRIFFLDGTPTTMTFEIGRDEPSVIDWFGLGGMSHGERLWIDIAATEVGTVIPVEKRPRRSRLEAVSGS